MSELTKLRDLLGGGTESVVSQTFEKMEVAEQVLAAHGLALRKGAFLVLTPPACTRNKAMRVYRSHAEELCRRMVAGEDLTKGTHAEMLCSIMDHATKAPLTMSYMAAATILFGGVMGVLPADFAPLGRNEEHNAREIIAELARVVVDPDRRLPCP